MKFADVPGNKKTIRKLIKSINEGRVANSQMFVGPEGCGKMALAMAYASYLNCTNIQHFGEDSEIPSDSCGECPACRKIDKLEHPDIHYLFPIAKSGNKTNSRDFFADWRNFVRENKAVISLGSWYNFIQVEKSQGTISTEDVADIISRLNYKSYEAKFKVVIIWLAEKIYYSAAPKLLKTLEEPADNTVFILISEDQESMLSTILSRLQISKIVKPSVQETFDYVSSVCTDVDEKEIYNAVYYSERNLSKAVEYIKRKDEISAYANMYRTWMRACYSMRAKDVFSFVADFSKLGRERQKYFLGYCSDCISKSFYFTNQINRVHFNDNDDETFFKKFSPFITPESIPEISTLLETASYHIERNGNANLIMTDLSFDIGLILRNSR